MQQLVVQPPVSENGTCDEEDGMDLMAVNSSETFGIDGRIESLFPCKGSSVVKQKGTKDSQRVLSVLFSLARLEGDLDCWDSRSDWNTDVRGCTRR